MVQIQNLEPSRVIHELIIKPYGTYIIRSSTENDDILSSMKINGEKISIPYVVLSVRVNENKYHWPIMNYRLPSVETIDLIENYQRITNNSLPELKEELIIETEDTNWKIKDIQSDYMDVYPSNNKNIRKTMKFFIRHESNKIELFGKPMKNIEQEFTILKILSYFHIVQFYGIHEDTLNQMKYLIFAQHGESLKSKCLDMKYSDEKLTIKQLTMFGYQIACGMIYLESKHIIHRDLHAGNILIDEHNFLRIADFEHAITENDNRLDYESNFQRRRLAPECLPQLSKSEETIDLYETLLNEFSSKSDVWAYGLIFIELTLERNVDDVYYYLFTQSSMNDEQEMLQLVQDIKINRHIHRRPSDCPDNFYNILKRCWKYNPKDRISFMDVRNEMLKLFQSIN